MSRYDPYDAIRQITRDLDRWREISDSMHGHLAIVNEFERQKETLLGPKRQFDSLAASIREQLAIDQTRLHVFDISALTSLHDSSAYAKLSQLLAEQAKVATLQPEIYDFSGALFDPSDRLQDTLAQLEASVRLYNPTPGLLDLALELPVQYQGFTKKQLEKTKEENEEVVERRIEVIEAAGELLEQSEETVQMAAEMASESSSAEEAPERKHEEEENYQVSINLFQSLEPHTSQIIASNSDIQTAIEGTIPGRICEAGRGIAARVFEINRFSEYDADDAIFKPTNFAMMSMAALPCSLAFNSTEFGVVVDRLFFLLYEGSGDAKRITPIVPFDELPELLRLKHLRLGYRHDIDHGKPAEALKKKKDVGEAFKGLIGKPYPTESHEWPLAQLHLYEQISAMLDRIFERLVASRS